MECRVFVSSPNSKVEITLYRPRRKYDKHRVWTRNISTSENENFKDDVIFVSSPVTISLFRLTYFVLSCLRIRRINENQACFLISRFRPSGQSNENTKWQKSDNLLFRLCLRAFALSETALFRHPR